VRPARDAGSLPRLRNPSGSTDQTKVTHSAKTISVPISSMLRPPASTWRNRVLVVRPPLHAGTCPCAMTTASPVNCEKWENSPQPGWRAAIRVTHLGCRRVALKHLWCPIVIMLWLRWCLELLLSRVTRLEQRSGAYGQTVRAGATCDFRTKHLRCTERTIKFVCLTYLPVRYPLSGRSSQALDIADAKSGFGSSSFRSRPRHEWVRRRSSKI